LRLDPHREDPAEAEAHRRWSGPARRAARRPATSAPKACRRACADPVASTRSASSVRTRSRAPDLAPTTHRSGSPPGRDAVAVLCPRVQRSTSRLPAAVRPDPGGGAHGARHRLRSRRRRRSMSRRAAGRYARRPRNPTWLLPPATLRRRASARVRPSRHARAACAGADREVTSRTSPTRSLASPTKPPTLRSAAPRARRAPVARPSRLFA